MATLSKAYNKRAVKTDIALGIMHCVRTSESENCLEYALLVFHSSRNSALSQAAQAVSIKASLQKWWQGIPSIHLCCQLARKCVEPAATAAARA